MFQEEKERVGERTYERETKDCLFCNYLRRTENCCGFFFRSSATKAKLMRMSFGALNGISQ